MHGVNFIPAQIIKAQVQRTHLRGWITAIIVVAIALMIPLLMDATAKARAENLSEEHGQLVVALKQTQTRAVEIANETIRIKGQIERARALRSKRNWSSLIILIGSCLPPETWLATLRTDPDTPTGTGEFGPGRAFGKKGEKKATKTVTIEAPRKLLIVGYAVDNDSPYEFIKKLKETKVFSKITLLHSRRDPGKQQSNVGFEVMCEW